APPRPPTVGMSFTRSRSSTTTRKHAGRTTSPGTQRRRKSRKCSRRRAARNSLRGRMNMSQPQEKNAPASEGPDRRDFLQAGIAVTTLGAALAATGEPDQGKEEVPRRQFGRSKDRVSALGLGGHTLGLAPTLREAIRIVH